VRLRRRAQPFSHPDARTFEDPGVAEHRERQVCSDEHGVGVERDLGGSAAAEISPSDCASRIPPSIACIQPPTNSPIRSRTGPGRTFISAATAAVV
jgi:hypothetical protein